MSSEDWVTALLLLPPLPPSMKNGEFRRPPAALAGNEAIMRAISTWGEEWKRKIKNPE